MNLEAALEKIGGGISMNAFFLEFDYEASMILDRLLYLGKVKLYRVRKHQMTVIMPR